MRTRWVLLLAVGLPLTLVAGFVWFMVGHDGRQGIDLGAGAHPRDAWTREMMPGAHWATDELCGAELPCIQAVSSETLTMYRFEERRAAVAAAERVGTEGYLTGWIVVRYEPGRLTAAQRTDFQSTISCGNTSVSEDGQDC